MTGPLFDNFFFRYRHAINCTEQEYIMRENFLHVIFFLIVTVCLNRHFFFFTCEVDISYFIHCQETAIIL